MADRVAIVGSRDFPDLDIVRYFVDRLPEGTVVISGGARGVDRAAADHARARGLEVVEHLPDWERWPYKEYGPKALFERNTVIAEDCHRMSSFWNGTSSGTTDSIIKTRWLKKPVKIILPDGSDRLQAMRRLNDREQVMRRRQQRAQ